MDKISSREGMARDYSPVFTSGKRSTWTACLNSYLAVNKGVVREVYRIIQWHPAGSLTYRTRDIADVRVPGRWEFEGHVAEPTMRMRYIDQSVAQYFQGGSQNPVTYVNC
jgi:hypothetical protein